MIIFYFGLESTTKAPVSKPTSTPPSKSNYHTFLFSIFILVLVKKFMQILLFKQLTFISRM